MGQYWIPVNLDKREFIHPHKLGDGLKLGEMIYNSGVGAGLVILTAAYRERRGGGDLDLVENWHGPERTFPEPYPAIAQRTCGRWAGDRIAIVGDYATDSDLPPEFEASKIYSLCNSREDIDDPEYLERLAEDGITPDQFFTDISEDVCAVLEHELRGSFIGTGWRTFVDVPRDELWEPGDVITLMRHGHCFGMRTGKGYRDYTTVGLPEATELEILAIEYYHVVAKIVAHPQKGMVGREVFVNRDALPRREVPFTYIRDLAEPRGQDDVADVTLTTESGYTVHNPLSDRAACSCPDFRYRRAAKGEVCKHIRDIRESVGV
jgi:hypothetical protein